MYGADFLDTSVD